MIDFNQNNTHIISFWKIPHLSIKSHYKQALSYKVFKTSSFTDFANTTLLNSEENNLLNHTKNLAIEAFETVEKKLHLDLEILNTRKVNEDNLVDFSFDNETDVGFVDGDKYLSIKFNRDITLFIDLSYNLTHIKFKRILDVKKLKFLNFNGSKFTTPIYKKGLDFGDSKTEEYNIKDLSKYYLNYDGVYSLTEPILFDKRFIIYWNSYLNIGNELFFFKAIKFDAPFTIKNTKTQEDYIELLKEEGVWLGSRIDKLCERNGKVKDLINANKIQGEKNASGYWVTDVYQFLKYLEQSNHSSNQFLLDKFLANHFGI